MLVVLSAEQQLSVTVAGLFLHDMNNEAAALCSVYICKRSMILDIVGACSSHSYQSPPPLGNTRQGGA